MLKETWELAKACRCKDGIQLIFADFPKTAFGPSSSKSKLTPGQCFQDVMQMSADLELFLWHLRRALLKAGTDCRLGLCPLGLTACRAHRVIRTSWPSKLFEAQLSPELLPSSAAGRASGPGLGSYTSL